jgi:hypothetical protein
VIDPVGQFHELRGKTASQSEGSQVPRTRTQSRWVSERDRPLEGVALWPNQTKGAISEPGLGGLPTEGTPQDSGQMRRRDWSRERVGDPGRQAPRPRNSNNESFPIEPRGPQVWRTARLNLAIGRGIHGRSTGKDLGHTLAWLEGSRFGVTGGSQPALLSGR